MNTKLCLLFALILTSTVYAQQSQARVVELKTADGAILKGTYFPASHPGPGVLLFHQSNRTRESWKDVAEQLEIDGRYAGYLKRQEADIHAFRRDEALLLPVDLDYDAVLSLSTEVREKLKLARPATLGAAGRISGVTPAALTILLRHVRRRDKQSDKLSA